MTDRELLELAAKAAEICGHYADRHPEFGDDWEELGIWYNNPDDCTSCWNPLTDDGDALRLAVKLDMNIVFCANYVLVDNNVQNPTVNNESDKYSAIRMAIVRAAAEIGKSIE